MEPDLFAVTAALPLGFRYEAGLLDEALQQALVEKIAKLPLQAFDFHGFKANRRVVSYGWRYDFSAAKLVEIEPIPEWIRPLRERVGKFAGTAGDAFSHVLISEYAPGAGIGWHKDKAVFDQIVGVSLGADCPLRLRKEIGPGKWQRAEQLLAPGSMYLLSGEVRTVWEHSISPVRGLRYSFTFRTMKSPS